MSRCLGICFLLLVAMGIGEANDANKSLHAEESKSTEEIVCDAGKVCRERATNVPLRVLPRSFSRIYAAPDEKTVKYENVQAFHPLYVFQLRGVEATDSTNSNKWYQVGRKGADQPLGWMLAKDVLEWRQALIVSYTHHGTGEEARQKVMMFRSEEALKEIAQSPDVERKATRLYERLRKGDVPKSIVSKEPEAFVDIMKSFYVMPVVKFEKVDLKGEDARYLRVAAAVPGTQGVPPVVVDPGKPKDPTKLALDIVFVMDMTRSMQPYMDNTKEALVRLAHVIDTKYAGELDGRVRFGLVGYRDDTRVTPELEFTSHNFTPELMSAKELVRVLANEARAAQVSSQGYSEEMFAGVKLALGDTRWSEDTVKLIIVVGDASSHPPGHPQNTTQLDAQGLRELARDRQIHIMAIHLKDAAFSSDHPVARAQFETLTQVAGSENRAYVDIDIAEPDSFLAAVRRITERVDERVETLGQGVKPRDPKDVVFKDSPSEKAGLAFDRIFDAALVEYLGREAVPPKFFDAWVLDRDLTDPAKHALNVRVLVDRRQLSDLLLGLDTVIKSLDRANLPQAKFLEALQELAAQTEKDPAGIAQARMLSATGLLPAFIESLPYTSEILSLTNEQFAEMTAEQKSGLQGRLRVKLQQYREIYENASGWVKLNDTDSRAEMVYPLGLDALP